MLHSRPKNDPALHNEPDLEPESDLDQQEEEEEEIQQAFQTVIIQQHQQQQQQQQQQPQQHQQQQPQQHQQQQQQPQQHHHQQGILGKTVVASDNDVTNGFVKDGKMLPYVFEANESGKSNFISL
jgi:hypothetical protein